MVMTSSEISSLIGQQQMMMAGQMQHAAMISQQAGSQTTGQNIMGRAVNTATGIGSPLLQGGMALAGADPFSMGIRGGMAGFAAGGIAGAAGGAALGAGAVGIPLMAAQYASQQVLQGMSQQQNLNAALSQNYGFMGQHGRGFTTGEMGGIGQAVRQQAMMKGPTGEFAGFEELGQLASRMGQMGMGNNVRNAFEFNDKFKKMLTQVKEIATAFNTSLEQAQQIMSSMRGSGIFQNQGQIAQQIREISMAGGLATSEVTGMMAVGSQLSRMIGGRGKAGAMGGMKTISNIGMAEQMGMLDEETLYDLTGQTGAEGRRALATQRMQQSAQFLRGGLGRRMLASMAGKNGMLDEESAEEWEGGGVGTDRTMGMAGRNLGRVGRANFIRNEGRLRGEVLGRFGGLAPIAAMSSWLEQRGMDPNSDRGQIFMSRRLGMSVEEVQQQLKEYRGLERMEAKKADITADAKARSQVEDYQQSIGLKGIKKKFDAAKNTVENTLRQKGAEFFEAGSEMIEEWVNGITGEFVMTVDRDVGEAIRAARSGFGAYGKGIAERRFGFGRGTIGADIGQKTMERLRGSGLSPEETFKKTGGAQAYREAGWGVKGVEDLERVRAIQSAGREGTVGGTYAKYGEEHREALWMASSFGSMGKGENFLEKFGGLLARKDPKLMEAYNAADAEGKARIAKDMLGAAGLSHVVDNALASPEDKLMVGGGWRSTGERDRVYGGIIARNRDAFFEDRVASRRGQVAGFVTGFSATALGPGVDAARLGKGAADLYERAMRMGQDEKTGDVVETAGRSLVSGAGLAGGMMGPVGSLFGAAGNLADTVLGGAVSERFGKWVRGIHEEETGGMGARERQQTAAFLRTEKGRNLLQDALSRDPQRRADAAVSALERSQELMANVKGDHTQLNELERGELEAQRTAFVNAKAAGLIEESERTGAPISEEQKAKLLGNLSEMGVTKWKDVENYIALGTGITSEAQADSRREYYRRTRDSAREEQKRYQRLGILKDGKLTGAAVEDRGAAPEDIAAMSKVRGAGPMVTGLDMKDEAVQQIMKVAGTNQLSAGALFAASEAAAVELEARIGVGDTKENERLARLAQRVRETGTEKGLGAMSVKDLREDAKRRREMGDREGGAYLGRLAKDSQKLATAGRRGGGHFLGREAANMLGLDLSREDFESMRGMDADKMAETLMSAGGVKGDDIQKQLATALKAAKEGKGALAATGIAGVGGEFAEAQREAKYKAAEKDDPSVRKLDEVKNAINELKSAQLKTFVVNASEIAGTADPESKGVMPKGAGKI